MSTTEIVLLIIGGLFFAISFFLPDGKKKKEDERLTEERIKSLIDKEMESAKVRIDDIVDETVNYSIEKTERALERLSNEKIMAVDEYSETVLKKINDNHNEAVFLYDMLNDKDEKLKNTTEELKVSKTELEIQRQQINDRKLEMDRAMEAARLKAVAEREAEERAKAAADLEKIEAKILENESDKPVSEAELDKDSKETDETGVLLTEEKQDKAKSFALSCFSFDRRKTG